MKNILFNYFTIDNISGKKCTEKWLSKNNLDLYSSIVEWCNKNDKIKDLEFKRKVYHYINNLYDIPVCLKCGSYVKYKRFRDGYNNYCSSNCQYSCTIAYNKWLTSWRKNNSNGEFIIKRLKTSIDKYGDSDTYNDYVSSKIKESCLKKYGVEYVTQTDSYKRKRKKSLLEKYGSENYNNSDKTRDTRIRNKTQIDDSIVNDFKSYKKIIINRTLTIYRNNMDLINPNKLKRGKVEYHIDHKFSIKQGYIMNIPIEIITHPCNLHMIYYKNNLEKQDNCSIELKKLLLEIINSNINLNLNHSILKNKYNEVKLLAENLIDKF